jgi:hypothetical protein
MAERSQQQGNKPVLFVFTPTKFRVNTTENYEEWKKEVRKKLSETLNIETMRADCLESVSYCGPGPADGCDCDCV